MTSRARVCVLAGLFLVAVLALELPDQRPARQSRPAAPAASTPVPSPTPPRLAPAQINQQDRVSAAHRRREDQDLRRRPLLTVLPLELAGVRVDIAGIGAHATTTIAITPGPRGRAYARALYRRALAAFGDPGTAYRVRWAP